MTRTLQLVLTLLIATSTTTKAAEIQCEKYDASKCNGTEESCTTIETCSPEYVHDKPNNCFALWKEDPPGNNSLSLKGCFTQNQACNQSACIDSNYEAKKNIRFCCCNGSLCNHEYRWQPTATEAPPVHDGEDIEPPPLPHSHEKLIIILVLVTTASLALGIVTFYVVVKNRRMPNYHPTPTNDPENMTSILTEHEIESIKLLEVRARGRFGIVWKAQMQPQDVAVKIFPMQDKQSWITEQEIFKLPRLKHQNILEFIGALKKDDEEGEPKLWLITSYHPNGSLCDYLKSHTLTWAEMCKIAESMARGLMHLHEEISSTRPELYKPAIAHRDFKSKNVLLKDDLTACIADFGLALVFKPGESCGDSHGQVGQVGTWRYMAPEILEGAINFTRDAFLRIDVYACGLVLWELVSRCTVQGIANDYQLPFEMELDTHPSLEQMQDFVVTKKRRPTINPEWRKHSGLNAFCDTMEECWDHDAEARLSSSCVMERVAQHFKYQSTPPMIETNTFINKDGDST